MTDLSTLKAVAQRHAEMHNRVPAHVVLALLAAIEQLELAISQRAAA